VTELFLTYLLRSGILLSFTLLLVHLPGLRRAGARDVLLKVALFASVASPFLPTNLLPTIRLEPIVLYKPSTLPTMAPSPEEFTDPTGLVETTLVQERREANQANRLGWHNFSLVLIVVGAFISLLQFSRAWWTVRRLISRATPITRELHSELTTEARVRILSVTELSSPAAFGGRTIFIPEHLLGNLSKRQLQSVLAHETAHLRRCDPFWNAGFSFLTLLCFFQPLNFLVLYTWRRASEEICDAEAARVTRDPLLLARTLLEVARGQSTLPKLLTTGIASTTHLSKRITSLLNAKEVYMKRSYLILSSLLPIFVTLLLPFVTFAQNTQHAKTVVLDAGHGGRDPGATGYANEAQVNLSIAKKVRELLEAEGINVVMTREDDSYVELEQRVKFANSETSLFLSIHANIAPSPNVSGVATWVYNSNNTVIVYGSDFDVTFDSATDIQAEHEPDDTQETLELSLAQNLQTELVAATGAKDRGTRQGEFYILQNARVPAIMLDVGFVSNPDEGAKLSTDAYQQTLAKAIAKTLVDYLE
jgi:N-acetylmuramoyl-L-alanine amidase